MTDCVKCTGEWTLNTLLAHLTYIIEANDHRYEERFKSTQEAVSKAERSTEIHFNSVNEFRAALGDQQKFMITRKEVEAHIQSLEDKIKSLHDSQKFSEGSGEAHIQSLEDKIKSLYDSQKFSEGSCSGKTAFWGYIVGAFGLVSLIITIIHMIVTK